MERPNLRKTPNEQLTPGESRYILEPSSIAEGQPEMSSTSASSPIERESFALGR
jgi:hypothetical protein